MLDEFKIVGEMYDKLGRQLDFINDYLNDDVRKIFTDLHNLECRYEVPYLFYLTRQYKGVYNKDHSYLTDFMEKKLDEYVKSNADNKLTLKLYDIKRMIFSVYCDGFELLRFSLTNKNYGYTYGTLHDQNSLDKMIERSNNQIVYNNEQIIEYLLEINKYKRFKDNYFNLFKEVKSLKSLFKLIFKHKEMTQAVELYITRREDIIEELERQNEKENLNQEYYRKKYEENSAIAKNLNIMFEDLGYKADKLEKFYT